MVDRSALDCLAKERKRRTEDAQEAATRSMTDTATTTLKMGRRSHHIPRSRRDTQHKHHRTRRRRGGLLAIATFAASVPGAFAQNCISLQESSRCTGFRASSISTDAANVGLFPFLSSVTDAASFDQQIESYVTGDYMQLRFQQLIGCSNFSSQNPDVYYARYTTSVLCNAVVQNSIATCSLSGDATSPLCADTCALYAQSVQSIASSDACGTTGPNAESQIRSDLTTCALPAQSLEGSCIPGVLNEPTDCGFANNLDGLCGYCGAGSPNATDSCCVFSATQTRCEGITLPIGPASSTPSPSSPAPTSDTGLDEDSNTSSRGLSGGAIAGIVVGSVLGGLILLALLVLGCIILRRRRRRKVSPANSVHSQLPPMATNRIHSGGGLRPTTKSSGGTALSGSGRVTRMSAIEPPGGVGAHHDGARDSYAAGLAHGAMYHSSSGGETPTAPPRRKRSSNNMRMDQVAAGARFSDSSYPETTEGDGAAPSERLAFFKDYYSLDEVRAGDLVSTLWAYQPRARDEFELERGDMLKVVGIWDDGWATGIRVGGRAEEWDLGEGDGRRGRDSVADDMDDEELDGEVRAFPLVCVCVPSHWRRTVEGDSTDPLGGQESGSSP